MADESPSPENNPILRSMAGYRREMREMLDRQARIIDQQNKIALRVDESIDRMREELAYLRRDMTGIRSDLVLMENRVLTAIAEVQRIAARLDEGDASDESEADLSDDDKPVPPAAPPRRHG